MDRHSSKRRLRVGDEYRLWEDDPRLYRVLRVSDYSATVKQVGGLPERSVTRRLDALDGGGEKTVTFAVPGRPYTVSPYSAVYVTKEGPAPQRTRVPLDVPVVVDSEADSRP